VCVRAVQAMPLPWLGLEVVACAEGRVLHAAIVWQLVLGLGCIRSGCACILMQRMHCLACGTIINRAVLGL
jgi:hypothetical protein